MEGVGPEVNFIKSCRERGAREEVVDVVTLSATARADILSLLLDN